MVASDDDMSDAIAINNEDKKGNEVIKNNERIERDEKSDDYEVDDINKVAKIERHEDISQCNNGNNLPGSVARDDVDMNIMHPIHQSDDDHEDDDHTSTWKANIDHHEKQNIVNTPAGRTVTRTHSDFIRNDGTFEFLTSAEPEDATIGSLVRVMWNPGTGSSSCWVQGEIYK